MAEEPLLPGRQYLLKLGTQSVPATVQRAQIQARHRHDGAGRRRARWRSTRSASPIRTARPIAFEPYEASRALGGFILIDRISGATVAAGLIRFALRRSENVHEQALDGDAGAARGR